MLSELYIKNLAVIEKTNICFEPGLNVFTGETGAGKSIVIDAINAILGQRTSKDIVRTGEDKAVINAVFTELDADVLKTLDDYGYEAEDGVLMIQREISADGKSSARICGSPVTASVLREVGSHLINIHGQHDNQVLLQPEKHLSILDAFGSVEAEKEAYYASYRKLVQLKKEISQIDTDESEKERKADLLRYQIQEIKGAELQPGEEETLENDKKALLNYSNILESLQNAYASLFGNDDMIGAADGLSEAAQYDGNIGELSEKLTDLSYQLGDVAQEVSSLLQNMEYDPRQLDDIEERLNLLFKLKRKYGDSVEKIQEYLAIAQEELEGIELSDERLTELKAQEQQELMLARELAEQLSVRRREAAERLVMQITSELQFLDMPNVKLTVDFKKTPLRVNGKDEVEFFISTNPGEPPKPISKIASGGELSRIMLAIKNALADKDNVPTLIFDEVDTGISGRAAQKVGLKLKSVAKNRQVVCVTHLAQIAALGDNHFLIRKDFTEDKTYTNVHKLDFEGRKQEIARIIGTDQITDLTLKNAEEMLLQGNH